MRPGLSSNHFRTSPVTRAIDVAARLAYAGVEVWIEHLWETGEGCGTIRGFAAARNLRLTVHGPICDVNVTSANRGIRAESRRQYRRALDAAARLGADVLVLYPGALSAGDGSAAACWDALVECFAELADAAERSGVRIGLEHMEVKPGEFIVHPDDVLRVVRAVGSPSLGLTLDIAHLLFSGQTADIPSLVPHLFEVHISGSTATRPHVPLRAGIYDLRPALRSVAAVYRGTVVIEGRVPGQEIETVTSNRAAFDDLTRELE